MDVGRVWMSMASEKGQWKVWMLLEHERAFLRATRKDWMLLEHEKATWKAWMLLEHGRVNMKDREGGDIDMQESQH